MSSMSGSPARTEGRDYTTDSASVDRSPLGAGYFSGDNTTHQGDESMAAEDPRFFVSHSQKCDSLFKCAATPTPM